MSIRYAAGLGLLLLWPTSVFAQHEPPNAGMALVPGDGTVDGTLLEPFSVVWTATPYAPDGQRRASNKVEERVEVVEGDGTPWLRFTQVWYDSLGAELFTTVRVADRRTMEYRAFHTGAAPGGFGHLDFDGDHVSGVYFEGPIGPSHYYSLKLPGPVFASFGGLLFATLPLEAGFQAEFPAFGWGGSSNPTLRQDRFRVAEAESTSVTGHGSIQTYPLTLERPGGGALTYWIAKQQPYFVRAESRSATGARTVFEVESWSAIPEG